jgi:hypothetical protein
MCTPCRQLWFAAFGPDPGADAFAAMSATEPLARWLAAVVLGGQGHYAAAATVLHGLLAHPGPPWASLAASTLASHRRQLGAHAAARRLDAVALRRCSPVRVAVTGSDPVNTLGARADAFIGLAADSIGLGRLPAAHRLVVAAEREVEASTWWRPAVRLAWVRAELALASGAPAAAVEPAGTAVRLAETAGAVRHAAKSRLVLAAALHTSGRPGADELLHQVVDTAATHRLASLRWPAEWLLAELHRGGAHADRHRVGAGTALRFVLRRADLRLRTAAESSLWVPSKVLQTGDSAERSSAGEILSEICTRLCQGSTPRDR